MYRVEKIGDLECTIVDDLQGNERPKLAVVLAHGFGAPGSDLVSIAQILIKDYPQIAANTRFVFPAAPIELDRVGIPGGLAWWQLDTQALLRANQTKNYDILRTEEPKGLAEARTKFESVLNYLQGADGIPLSRIVIGGFSQGAMLATDVALRLKELPAALVVLSGTLTNEKQWRELAAQRGKLKILHTHGYQDPILPFVAATWLQELFESNGMDLEFVPFQGGHGIPNIAMERLAHHLISLLGD